MTDIAGKAAVVTGGGSGIGMGLAKELGRQGARVAVADIQLAKAEAVAAAIRDAGGEAIAIACDVTERASINAMRDAAIAALGPVSLVFANAGATSFTPLVDMTDADVDWIVQVNLMGVMNSTRAFLPGMIAAGGGHICATSSMAGLLPGWMPVHVPYSAAKMGIIGMMMNLAIELRPHNVFTTIYCPGGVASGMKANNGAYRPDKFGGPEPVAEVQFSGTDKTHSSMAFFLPEDVAPMVLNAVSDNRPFVFDHADQRRLFAETYASVVEACYDDLDQWHARHGVPQGNPTGADLID
ncbi:SDR family oxidoreductase [Novosphingobium sp.]|uniref:SDR family NAD(P)-dependent oxidoreductase n=1 Tax=Novosphingobium sp. TaxID=1874826 RepID=UPI00286EA10C|nr:SDR family oxidoreductase [Novosphingobium sp.]